MQLKTGVVQLLDPFIVGYEPSVYFLQSWVRNPQKNAVVSTSKTYN